MLLAVAGTAALVMVVVTSIKAARRRLRYETWHLLHLYAYLGVGLALPHQLWTGQEFLASTGRTVFWWGLWIAAAVAVLVWRVALPLWRSARHGLRVTSVVAEGDRRGVGVHGRAATLGPAPVEAGQFFSWRFLSGAGWTRAHPYSLSAAPDGRSLRITVKDRRRRQRPAAAAAPGHPRARRGPVRPAQRPGPHPAARWRSSAPASASPRCAPWPRSWTTRPGDAVLLHRFTDRPLFVPEFEPGRAAEAGCR